MARYYLLLLAASVIALIAVTWFFMFSTFSSHVAEQDLTIDNDDNIDSVVAKLRPIANSYSLSAFTTLARYTHYEKHIRTGRYTIAPDDITFNVFRHIKNGQQKPVRLTIPEVRTMHRLAGVLARRLMLDSLTLDSAFLDSTFCRRAGYDTLTLPALFIPNTYDIYWNISLERFISRMQRENRAFWNEERLKKAKVIGLTPVEVYTLASIIDEETANNAEKPVIAGMYINRLHHSMPLQADPTIKFALGDFALKRIYHGQLDVKSPYNTYRNIGLPPGPIKIASVAAIDAVLNYVKHDYLYMCAKEDFSGTHNFARSYKEHLQNAARYSKALNEHGIR